LGGVQVVNLVKPITSLKKLQVLLNLSPEIPEFVVGDEKRLMQTALNVVGNAVKFTKEGSISIKVCLERPDYPMDPLMLEFHPVQGEHHRYIRVEVRDTGVGLNPQDIPKLFNKFLQADSTTTRNYGGTGLGLAICKRYV
jgi:ethylene receptor